MTPTRTANHVSPHVDTEALAPPDVIRVSDWYADLGDTTFPTVFLRLREAEIAALVAGQADGDVVRGVQARLDHTISELPGSSFVHADACAPTDAPAFQAGDIAVKTGKAAWQMLIGSQKVRAAFQSGVTERLCLHPYRRMDRIRELRMFIRGRRLVGMSQYNLQRHFGRLAARQDAIWSAGQELAVRIADLLPRDDQTIDVYVTSSGALIVLDLNPWGPPTDPLLYREWDHDWSDTPGLRLIQKPMELKGDVEVSF